MTGRDVMDLMTARQKHVTGINVNLNQQNIDSDFITKFHDVVAPYKEGTCPLNIYYQTPDAQAKLTLGIQWRVSPEDDLLHHLKPLVDNVELQFG
jgi:DNA polymerase-3 subunit alpha